MAAPSLGNYKPTNPFTPKPTTPTYNPGTGTYTKPSGETQSRSPQNVPKNTTIVGGAGINNTYDTRPTPPQTTQAISTPAAASGQTEASVKAQTVSLNAPAQVISGPQPLNRNIQNAIASNYARQAYADLPIGQSSIQLYKPIAGNYSSGYSKESFRTATPQERRMAGEQIGYQVPGQAGRYGFTASGRGTIQAKNDMTVGQAAQISAGITSAKAQSIVTTTYDKNIEKLKPIAIENVNAQQAELQGKVDRGELSVGDANKILSSHVESVNKLINEKATSMTKEEVKSNPTIQRLDKQYGSQKAYIDSLEKTKNEKTAELSRNILEGVATIIPQSAPLFFGKAMKESQKETIVIEDLNKPPKDFNLAISVTSPETARYAGLGVSAASLGATSGIISSARGVTAARIESQIAALNKNVGARVNIGETRFADIITSKKATPSGLSLTDIKVLGKVNGNEVQTLGRGTSAIRVQDFLTGKELTLIAQGKSTGKSILMPVTEEGITPSFSLVKTTPRATMSIRRGYGGEIDINLNRIYNPGKKGIKGILFSEEPAERLLGGAASKSGSYIKSASGDINQIDLIATSEGKRASRINFDVNDITLLKEINKAEGGAGEFNIGSSLKTTAKSRTAPSTAEELQKSISKQLSEAGKQIGKTGRAPRIFSSATASVSSTEIKEKNILGMNSASVIETKTKQNDILMPLNDLIALPKTEQKNIVLPASDIISLPGVQQQERLSLKSLQSPALTQAPATMSDFGLGGFNIVFPPFGKGLEPGSIGSGRAPRARKKRKTKAAYAADFASAAFDIKANVSPKKYKQLQEAVFSGLENRPILNIVTKKGKKKKGVDFSKILP